MYLLFIIKKKVTKRVVWMKGTDGKVKRCRTGKQGERERERERESQSLEHGERWKLLTWIASCLAAFTSAYTSTTSTSSLILRFVTILRSLFHFFIFFIFYIQCFPNKCVLFAKFWKTVFIFSKFLKIKKFKYKR